MTLVSLFSGLKSPTPNEYNIGQVLMLNNIDLLLSLIVSPFEVN